MVVAGVQGVTVADVLLALSGAGLPEARALAASAAAEDPESGLASALRSFLDDIGEQKVYGEPTNFEAFIEGGGNPELYANAIAHLSAVHQREEPVAVLDIGCGDGRVTAAVLTPATERVDLVDPSEALLESATARLLGLELTVTPHVAGIVEYLTTLEPLAHWDLAMSSFALHTLSPPERIRVLGLLVGRVQRLLIVEFDVPAFADRSPEHAAYAAARYELGVREYADQPEVVSGFLMPVLVGQFDELQPRLTFEQPLDEWANQLVSSGWTEVQRTRVADYWWAPAVCIEAIPR